jgi:hypothetical protein
MVSQLSARLLNCYSSGNSSGSSSKGNPQSQTSTSKPSGGYTADIESQLSLSEVKKSVGDGNGSLPLCIDLLYGHHKRENASENSRDPKRRKILELNYLASTAKIELARAGKSCPAIRVDNPCMLATSEGVDMSKVHFLLGKKVASPFLAPRATLETISQESYLDGIIGVFRTCSSHYKPPPVSSVSETRSDMGADGDGTTSFVTDNESDDGEEAKTDDIGNYSKDQSITMADALSLCKQPRYVEIMCALEWTTCI